VSDGCVELRFALRGNWWWKLRGSETNDKTNFPLLKEIWAGKKSAM